MEDKVIIGDKVFSESNEIKIFANNKNGSENNNKSRPPKITDPKLYLFDKSLRLILDELAYRGDIKSDYSRIGDSYAVEMTASGSMLIIYITSDGMFVVTKVNPSTGGYEGAGDVSVPNAIICGPKILYSALKTVDRKVKDNKSLLEKMWEYYFGGPTSFSSISDSNLKLFSETYTEIFTDNKDKGNKNKGENKNKGNKNNQSKPKESVHRSIFEEDLINHLNHLKDEDQVIEWRKIGRDYAVQVSRDRAIFVYITATGDYILSKINKNTGGYVGANMPNNLNAIICGPKQFDRAFRTMLYRVKDKEGNMERLWREYFT